MPRPPLSSTLFPYTTLFRSTPADLLETSVAFCRAGLAGNELCLWVLSGILPLEQVKTALRAAVPDLDAHLARGDRKSTRLNSSHRCKSYAVFCLKKKTTASK